MGLDDGLPSLAAESCAVATWALASGRARLAALAIADAAEILRLRVPARGRRRALGLFDRSCLGRLQPPRTPRKCQVVSAAEVSSVATGEGLWPRAAVLRSSRPTLLQLPYCSAHALPPSNPPGHRREYGRELQTSRGPVWRCFLQTLPYAAMERPESPQARLDVRDEMAGNCGATCGPSFVSE